MLNDEVNTTGSKKLDTLNGPISRGEVYLRSINNLSDVVKTALESTAKEGDVFLFSPGFTSFGMFKNEYDRGEKFMELVNSLLVMTSEVKELIEEAIEEKIFPGCSFGRISTTGAEIYNFGKFTYEEDSKDVDESTIYDVASITKLVSTGFLCMQALRDEKINLEEKIKKYFPQFQSEMQRLSICFHIHSTTKILLKRKRNG